MATRAEREKRRAHRLNKAAIAKQKQAEIEEVVVEDELTKESELLESQLEETAELELAQKDMYGAEMSMMGGPTSFTELDEMHEAMERNEQIQETSYSVQQLVRNIIYHPMLSVEEKSNAIKAVGNEFGTRVQEIMDSPIEKELDMDLLELEALIAKDYRNMSVSEKVGNWISKAVLTAESEKKLSDDDFALPSKRKYPIHDKAHVRNALARAAQMMKRGGEAAADAKAAMPKIRAAAKKMGIGMEKDRGIIIEKDASGSWRWVGYPTNNFKDRSEDIIVEKAHIDYVDWINEDIQKNAPVFTSCHAPGTVRENPVDFAAYENGFVVMSGKLTEPEAAALLKASAKCDVGMSHTGWAWRDAENPQQIIKYRSFEVTDLPIETADNPFTLLEISKEATVDQLAYLTELLGSKEKAEQALKLKTSLKQKDLQDAGVESKEGKIEEVPAEASEKEMSVEEMRAMMKKKGMNPEGMSMEEMKKKLGMSKERVDTDEIVAQVLKELDVDGLQEYLVKANEAIEKVPVLEELVKNLSQSRDDELAEMIAPKAEKKFMWSKARASENDQNVASKENAEDQKLIDSVAVLPDDWSKAFGVNPLTQ